MWCTRKATNCYFHVSRGEKKPTFFPQSETFINSEIIFHLSSKVKKRQLINYWGHPLVAWHEWFLLKLHDSFPNHHISPTSDWKKHPKIGDSFESDLPKKLGRNFQGWSSGSNNQPSRVVNSNATTGGATYDAMIYGRFPMFSTMNFR